MKIEEQKIIEIKEIRMGETFRYRGSIWMVIYEVPTKDEESPIACVNLGTGIWELFSSEISVTPVNAKVVIE